MVRRRFNKVEAILKLFKAMLKLFINTDVPYLYHEELKRYFIQTQ